MADNMNTDLPRLESQDLQGTRVAGTTINDGRDLVNRSETRSCFKKSWIFVLVCAMLMLFDIIILGVNEGIDRESATDVNYSKELKECDFHTGDLSSKNAILLISIFIIPQIIVAIVHAFLSSGRKNCKRVLFVLFTVLLITTTIFLSLLSATLKSASNTYQEVANGDADCKLNFTFTVTIFFWIYAIFNWIAYVWILCYCCVQCAIGHDE